MEVSVLDETDKTQNLCIISIYIIILF